MSGISKRVSGSWVSGDYGITKTATDTIITLPAVIHPTVATATVGLKGQAVRSGTPTPDTPIQPQECGNLETTGEHAGQYKITISSANTTTPVYLGEVETTRRIRKLVLTGEEDIIFASVTQGNLFRYQIVEPLGIEGNIIGICSHYPVVKRTNRANKTLSGNGGLTLIQFDFIDNDYSDSTDFKTFLQQQYVNGTPVCVWYVLATPETGIVNEPLMKISTYADEVSGITIPVTAGGDTISVDTTVQPSEITANYKGWHPVQNVHERDNGAWT